GVVLRSDGRDIELVVRDAGNGFDESAANRGRGLGLTSMRERLKLVGGELFIDSCLGGGTTIVARAALSDATRPRRRLGDHVVSVQASA
ncbi:MAG TPA: ATP-binding protein, partial [Vicinamibacterales bacterium]|nr:ATP-binding protein [Vicinamibacterales bacterium]